MDARVEYEPRVRTVPLPSRGGAMAALDFGPAERPVDIVFSHANGFNARTYRSILAPLAAELRILAIDLRGHGATTLPAEPEGWTGWQVYARDVVAFLTAETQAPVVLAGHSMGATTSLLAAADAPERVRSLVMFEPVLIGETARRTPLWDSPLAKGAIRRRDSFPDRAAALEAYRGRGAFRTWREAQLADYVAAGFGDTADGQVTLTCRPAWEAANFAVHQYDPWAALARVRCPVRILRAETESTGADSAARLDALVAAGALRSEIVPGTTHFLPMERPELVRQALREAAAA
ncbi:MAG: Hydrolase [Phenylobacterium sp.]|nr:Hydrolase [Phenylobacterium sp.]